MASRILDASDMLPASNGGLQFGLFARRRDLSRSFLEVDCRTSGKRIGVTKTIEKK